MPSAIAGTFRRALWLQGQGALSFFLEQTLSIIVIDVLIAHDKDWSLGLLVLIAFLQAPAMPTALRRPSPTACLPRGYGRAGARNERLGESFSKW